MGSEKTAQSYASPRPLESDREPQTQDRLPSLPQESREREAARAHGERRVLERKDRPAPPPVARASIPGQVVAMPFFAALAENVRDYAIFLLDPQGIIAYWGEGARLMKWWTRDQAEGAHLRLLYPDGGSEDGTAEDHLRLAEERGEYTGEGQRVRADGSTFWAGVSLTALRNADGALLGFAKITRDMTARQASEDAMRKARESEARTSAREEANQKKLEFLTVLSHEIRTPVNAILGYTDLVELEPLSESQRAHLDRIRFSAGHLRGLVNDTLDLSRIDADRMPIKRAIGAVGPVVATALLMVEPLVNEKGVAIENELSGRASDTEYCGDADRVRQILVNILGNAIKFTPTGGRIVVSGGTTKRLAPEVDLEGDGPWTWVRVEDTGPGIPEDHLGRIFEPFEQADTTQGGSGLGITISKRLARLMEGDITVCSALGQGATFILWLPTGLPHRRAE